MRRYLSIYWFFAPVVIDLFFKASRSNPRVWVPFLLLGLILQCMEWQSRTKNNRDRLELFLIFYVCFVGGAILWFADELWARAFFYALTSFFGIGFILEWWRRARKVADANEETD
jgi:hypothetical protein